MAPLHLLASFLPAAAHAEDAPLGPPAEAARTPAEDPSTREGSWRWSALPNISYDTDDGFGLGARGQFDHRVPGYDPYRSSFVVHVFASTTGYQHHRFRLDLVGLGREHTLRLTGHFAYRAWLNDGYWGIGNGTVRDTLYEGPYDPLEPAKKHYHYTLIQPFSHLTLRANLGGPWVGYAALEGRYSAVRTYAGSLLEAQHPYGVDGGPAVQASGGMLYDTRAPEVTPTHGVLLEGGARVVEGFDGAPFGGPFLSARAYTTLFPGAVFATRWMGEYLAGDVPFYEMVHWGGFVPIAGFGGADTLRGIPFGRWRAPGKTVLNTELRLDTVRHPLLGEEMRWQILPLADVGAVFGAGEDATEPSPAMPLHPTVGLGLRGIWATTLVGRADFAFGWDRVREPDGFIHSTRDIGFYLAFDHTF